MTKNIRLLSILEQLSKRSILCIKDVALHFNVTVKSIQNDFKILNEYFGEQLIKKGDCYTLLTPDSFAQIFKSNPQTIKRFLHLVSMVDNLFYREFIEEHQTMLQGLTLSTTTVYQIENSPYENLKEENKKILEELESFIMHRNYINLTYTRPNIETHYFSHSIPLKILYLHDNWYLAVLTTNNVDNNSIFKKLRINFITKVQATTLEPKHFHADHTEKLKAENFLKNIQSPYSNLEKPTYRVKLKASVEIARYFKTKKYLKSQKVVKELEDGTLYITYEVNHELEIIPIVQRWIPYLQVMEPIELKEKIAQNVKQFMKGE
jgi:predicted DNA-binding transcriptional regulator YafY